MNESSELTELSSFFPLFPDHDFDQVTNEDYGWPVGFASYYPNELKRRIIAARLSVQLGTGLDYTLRRYVPDIESYDGKEQTEKRLDWRIKSICLTAVEDDIAIIREESAPAEGVPTFGRFAADLTCARGSYSLRVAFYLANRGALFEACVICRMILEQLSWSVRVFFLETYKEVVAVEPQRTLASLKDAHGGAGRFYGWLSEHSHWVYEAHNKAFNFVEGNPSVMLRSEKFKMESMVVLTLTCQIFQMSLRHMHPELQFGSVIKARSLTEKVLGVVDGAKHPRLAKDLETLRAFCILDDEDQTNG
jgi:hypothetical protein